MHIFIHLQKLTDCIHYVPRTVLGFRDTETDVYKGGMIVTSLFLVKVLFELFQA